MIRVIINWIKTLWRALLALLLGSDVLAESETTEQRRKNKRKVTPPEMSEKEIAALNQRKPHEVWNTVLVFPDPLPPIPREDTPTKKLLNFFKEAKTTIYLSINITSHVNLTEAILQKYRNGLLIQVVTDYDTSVRNNRGIKLWQLFGIDVRILGGNDYAKLNRFAIIDEEALIILSLNRTEQDTQGNNENVMVSTDQRLVSKYFKRFNKLYVMAEPPPPPAPKKPRRKTRRPTDPPRTDNDQMNDSPLR